MLNAQDLEQLAAKGLSPEKLEQQLACFATGFPDLEIRAAVSVENGLLRLSQAEEDSAIRTWNDYLAHHKGVAVKFVPASGAASRMFKNLFEFLNADYKVPQTPFEQQFFARIGYFAFYAELDAACLRNEGKNIEALLADGCYKEVVANLLEAKGLNYGALPKGLLRFHRYPSEIRTPFLEHLVEAALYATMGGVAKIHYTVSAEHRELFERHLAESLAEYEKRFGITFEVSFSEQKPSTDTVAATADNEPFRTSDGKLLFRPGGHGALIENLNDIDGDVVFIKNIDNVVPDKLKHETVEYKKALAGVLVALQKQTFDYLEDLEKSEISDEKLAKIAEFCEKRLNNFNEKLSELTRDELIMYLKRKLDRPIRVCGMVRNEGEPGGGPFLTVNSDGTVSPQILESSQISNPALMAEATHFNPVDLVCGIKNWKGEKFYLPDFVDPKTGFISSKSKDGRELKALELPGLWNGAMSNWNTIFVEVPIETFNPVKTVNDLLRPQHQ